MTSVSGDQVVMAVLAAVEERLPKLLEQLNDNAPRVAEASERGPGRPVKLTEPRAYRPVADFDADLPDGQLPQVLADSPGTPQQPDRAAASARQPHGQITWTVVLTVLHRQQGISATVVATQRYVAALVDAALLASPLDVAGRPCDVDLVGFSYDEIPGDKARSLGAGFVEVEVHVPYAIDPWQPDEELPVPVVDASVRVDAIPLDRPFRTVVSTPD